MATAFASEAAHIKGIGHLTAADIARGTGADETTVRAWLRAARSPSGERAERLGGHSSPRAARAGGGWAAFGGSAGPPGGGGAPPAGRLGCQTPPPLPNKKSPPDVIP